MKLKKNFSSETTVHYACTVQIWALSGLNRAVLAI
jgi:hypothetical protein